MQQEDMLMASAIFALCFVSNSNLSLSLSLSLPLSSPFLTPGHSMLHVSWLMVALSRIFVHHEAKSIIKWGVQETLDMQLDHSPLLVREHWRVSCQYCKFNFALNLRASMEQG